MQLEDRLGLLQTAEKIASREAKVVVIGLGYVGLPLCIEFANAGFNVTGIDVNSTKVESLNRGQSYILDVKEADLKSCFEKKKFKVVENYNPLKEADVIIICVPTPLNKTREPDVSCIIAVGEQIARYIRKGQVVILESTTYPGTTEEVILPMLKQKGGKVGEDFCLAFSPERIDPGNRHFSTATIPKIVGGVTPQCTEFAKKVYESIVEKVVLVSSSRVAEMAKLLENTFRAVNIALVNELALMCAKLNINVWEVIDAAATKPFGFMPFYPGPGLGGHCLPIDPIYLAWKAKLHGFESRFIELASQVNAYMPNYVVERVMAGLNEKGKPMKGSKLLVLGVTYKKNVNDTRESPALDIIEMLKERGAIVKFNDPYIASLDSIQWTALTPATLRAQDAVLLLTDHGDFDYDAIIRDAALIIDTRNIFKNHHSSNNVIRI